MAYDASFMLPILLAALLLLVILISALKINPFIAFIMVSVIAGLLLGIPLVNISKSIQKGIGDMLGSIIIVICTGAMVGKLVAESGAAQVIANTMIQLFGKKYLVWGLVSTGFVIGIPLFYNVGFVLAIPIIFALVYRFKLPAVYVGLPMMAALSVAHGFLPPHPSPVALVGIFHAKMSTTLLYGFIIAIPAIVVAGPLFASTLKNIQPLNTNSTFNTQELPAKLPGAANSFVSALLPVLILAVTSTILAFASADSFLAKFCLFLGDPSMLMMFTLLMVTYSLGLKQARSISAIMKIYEVGVKDIAMIVLIIGGAGALKQILLDSGVSNQIAILFQHLPLHPLVLGWLVAAAIRICLGSATVAGLTAASIMAPLMTTIQVEPALMVLAIGAGSLMLSHVNDTGFWMFKEYFNISLKDTFKSWSVMESIVSVTGLCGVLAIHWLVKLTGTI